MVQRQIAYTCMQRQTSEVPCPVTVTVMKPEVRTQTVQVPEVIQEQKTRNVNYIVMVPQQQTRTVNVCNMQTVQEQKTRDYTVMVAYQEAQQVQVPVCRMVAKTITCQVPTTNACACQ